MNCHLDLVNKNSDEFKVIEKYVRNTHGPTHTSYSLEILEVFKVNREREDVQFRKDIKQNKLLLWHGTRLTNFVGILSNGFKIPPIEAPSLAFTFGWFILIDVYNKIWFRQRCLFYRHSN